MFTVTKIFHSDFRVKGSKFLGYLCPANNLQDAEKALEDIKNEHPTATHHCYAYIIDPAQPEEFANDDGEPNGTAGMPILNALKSNKMVNVLLVAVRYYGGTKLGKAGLIEAYNLCAGAAVENATLKEIIPIQIYSIHYEYSYQGYIDKLKNSFLLFELSSEYSDTVKLSVGCKTEDISGFERTISSFRHLLLDFKIKDRGYHISE